MTGGDRKETVKELGFGWSGTVGCSSFHENARIVKQHFVGLDRAELRYVRDPADVMGPDYPSETLRVLKNKEMRQFGEYCTRRLVLDARDRMATAST